MDPAIPSLVRSLGQEDLHHQALVILVKPGPLRLAGLLAVVVGPGWLVVRRPQGRVVRRRPRRVRWGSDRGAHRGDARGGKDTGGCS
jgi:hypothetical protein